MARSTRPEHRRQRVHLTSHGTHVIPFGIFIRSHARHVQRRSIEVVLYQHAVHRSIEVSDDRIIVIASTRCEERQLTHQLLFFRVSWILAVNIDVNSQISHDIRVNALLRSGSPFWLA